MSPITIILAVLVAAEFCFIFYLETIAMTSARTAEVFNMTQEELSRDSVSTLFKNQGVYNGLIAVLMNYREAEAVTVSCFVERMENICRLSAYDSDAFSTGLYSPRSKGIFSAYLDCPIHTMVWAALMSLGAMYPQLAHLYMRCLSGILVFAPQIGHNCVVGSHLESTTTCPVWRISLFLTRPRTLCCILRP